MQSRLLSSYDQFKRDVEGYCRLHGMKHVALRDEDVQMLYLHHENEYRSPESDKNNEISRINLHPEVIRSLVRLASFQWMLSGTDDDYAAFTKAQGEMVKLERVRFTALSCELNSLDDDSREVIRASTILVRTTKISANVKAKYDVALDADGEAAITQLVKLAIDHPDVTPVTNQMKKSQRELLLKAFWPRLHMRWLYSTEGGAGMTNTLRAGIESGEFNQERDLKVWAWRWRLNVAGFHGGPGAKFYDGVSDDLINQAMLCLNKLYHDNHYQFLPDYLHEIAKQTFKLDDPSHEVLTEHESLWFAHLAAFIAYYHRSQSSQHDKFQKMLEAYRDYKAATDAPLTLAAAYAEFISNDKLITPTYVPGVMDTALGIFRIYAEKPDAVIPDAIDLYELFSKPSTHDAEALYHTTYFMCQLSTALYRADLTKQLSCMQLASVKVLRDVLKDWLQHNKEVSFSFDDKGQMSAKFSSALRLSGGKKKI